LLAEIAMSQSISAAEIAAIEALQSQARRSAAHLVKRRARAFAKHPMSLETLYPGLAVAEPATLIAVAGHLLDRARNTPQRWFGFGGEVTALNAKAALLYGRALRAKSHQSRDAGTLSRI
jgi:hypothetical protein